jgi:hypothetical protein
MSRQVSADGGWWEDDRGYVKGRRLRQRYHEACKELKKWERSVLSYANDDPRKAIQEEGLEKCRAELKEIEKEVSAEDFS